MSSKLYSYKLTLQYWGTHYHGWQKQTAQGLPTIQETLENAFNHISQTKQSYTIASGRTDAGVHALGQIVRVDLSVSVPEQNLLRAVNRLLPDDIKVSSIESCSLDFHPQKHAKQKEYRYHFTESNDSCVLQDLFVQKIDGEIDYSLMEEAAKLFIGEHDFSHYYCEGTPVNSYVRSIFNCGLIKQPAYAGLVNEHDVLVIEGSGFLKQMVRLIMGAIWDAARGKLSLDLIESSLRNPKSVSKRHLAALAPAKGLYLHHVNY